MLLPILSIPSAKAFCCSKSIPVPTCIKAVPYSLAPSVTPSQSIAKTLLITLPKAANPSMNPEILFIKLVFIASTNSVTVFLGSSNTDTIFPPSLAKASVRTLSIAPSPPKILSNF